MKFVGEFTQSLSQGNRLVIPARLRANMQSDQIIATRFEPNRLMISDGEHSGIVTELEKLSLLSAPVRDMYRLIGANTTKKQIDSQGRFLLEIEELNHLINLSSNAKSKKQIRFTIIGAGEFIEIWQTKYWEIYRDKLTRDQQDISERLAYIIRNGK